MNKAKSEGFEAGVLWAAAYLIRFHGEDSLAEWMVKESGADPRNADEMDMDALVSIRLLEADEPPEAKSDAKDRD